MAITRVLFPERITYYHITTRTPGGLRWLGPQHRDVLRSQLERTAYFCGVVVHSYAFMINHLHLLVMVPPKASAEALSDAEIIDRVATLYPRENRAEKLLEGLASADPGKRAVAVEERERYRALMCDLSIFMQLYKLRYSRWFNGKHERFGTMWSERFWSEALPSDPVALRRVAAYIDLNAVRAGLCDDPLFYRHCSYAEAVAVSGMARDGIAGLMKTDGLEVEEDWEDLHARYRRLLFESVSVAPEAHEEGDTAPANGPESKRGISAAKLGGVQQSNGHLADAVVRAHRARFLTPGAVLGPKPIPEASLQDNCNASTPERLQVSRGDSP